MMQSKFDVPPAPRLCDICRAALKDGEATVCRTCREGRSAGVDVQQVQQVQQVQHTVEGGAPDPVEEYRLHCESCPQCSAIPRKAIMGDPLPYRVKALTGETQ